MLSTGPGASTAGRFRLRDPADPAMLRESIAA